MTLDDDLDQDGFLLVDDCDDTDPEINLGSQEKPYNGIDDDCNPMTPDDDLDGDGFLHTEACNDWDPLVNPGIVDNTDYNCDREITWSELQNKRCRCWKEPMLSQELIEETLIGKWKLLAIKPEWNPATFYSCLKLEVNSTQIIIEDSDTGEIDTTAYQVEAKELETYTVFKLVIEAEKWKRKIGMNYFCEAFMFGTGSVADGDMYFYEKI